MTKVIITDGGRAEAGYKGTANDCVTRAFAIATGLPYQVAYDELRRFLSNCFEGGSPRSGVSMEVTRRFYGRMGWKFVDTMMVGGGKKFTIDDLPSGKVIALLDHHVSVVIDGTIHDAYDPTVDGNDSVLGYWSKG